MEILIVLVLFALLSPATTVASVPLAAIAGETYQGVGYYPPAGNPSLTPTVAVSQLPPNIAVPASVAALRAMPPVPSRYRATPPPPELLARAGRPHF